MKNRIYTFKTHHIKKKCDICGKTFTPNTRTQKYCCDKCYQEAVRQYQRQYKI